MDPSGENFRDTTGETAGTVGLISGMAKGASAGAVSPTAGPLAPASTQALSVAISEAGRGSVTERHARLNFPFQHLEKPALLALAGNNHCPIFTTLHQKVVAFHDKPTHLGGAGVAGQAMFLKNRRDISVEGRRRGSVSRLHVDRRPQPNPPQSKCEAA